jgi:hypothetical protein
MLRFLCMVENGPFESNGQPQSAHYQSHCSRVSVLNSQEQLCVTVWVEQVKGKESQPSVVKSLLVDTRRSAHKNLSRLGEFGSPNLSSALARVLATPL